MKQSNDSSLSGWEDPLNQEVSLDCFATLATTRLMTHVSFRTEAGHWQCRPFRGFLASPLVGARLLRCTRNDERT